eukprot:3735214-Pleurochrysis_carterae.AAC.2
MPRRHSHTLAHRDARTHARPNPTCKCARARGAARACAASASADGGSPATSASSVSVREKACGRTHGGDADTISNLNPGQTSNLNPGHKKGATSGAKCKKRRDVTLMASYGPLRGRRRELLSSCGSRALGSVQVEANAGWSA